MNGQHNSESAPTIDRSMIALDISFLLLGDYLWMHILGGPLKPKGEHFHGQLRLGGVSLRFAHYAFI